MQLKDTLPIPQYCDMCCSTNVVYTDNSAVYGRNYTEWPKCYLCLDCGAMVGCHLGTNIPMGRMANRETRKLRMIAHAAFDPLWKSGLMKRTEAYDWLARQLGIPLNECHISWFDMARLQEVARLAGNHYKYNKEIIERRKAKKRDKRAKHRQRQYKAATVRKFT